MVDAMFQSESSVGYKPMTPQLSAMRETGSMPSGLSVSFQEEGSPRSPSPSPREGDPLVKEYSQQLLVRDHSSKPLINKILREENPDEWRGSDRMKRFVILPGSATGRWWLEVWDLYISALVLAIAYFEPFALALYGPGNEPAEHAIINMTFNISFTIDMVLQFFISTQHSQDSVHKDLWEKDVRKLAEAYCSFPFSQEGRHGWFWVDLITVVPGWLTTLLVDPRLANPLYLLRILRLFQTARLARLAKLSEVLHAHYGFPFFVVEVCKFVVLTTLSCHWIACVWVFFEGKVTSGFISWSTDQESWLSALIAAKGDSCNPDAAHDPMCVFILAYYWAAMTLTSVGYGDITPQNKIEYCISVVCMFVVGYIWAFIVGTIVSILTNLDPGSVAFKRSLDDLGSLMRRRGLSQPLQVRLRTYMHETRHFMQLYDQRQLVERYFSDGLQREIAAHSAEVRGMLKNVYWMRELQEEAILDIVRGLRPRAYGQQEHIMLRGSMILMQRGLAGVKGRILSRGDVWGHNDILMETPQLIDSSMPRSLSFVELLMLAKSTLVEVGQSYPRADRRLRRAQIRTATARAFIYQANRIKATKKAAMRLRTKSALNVTAAVGKTRSVGAGTESSFANPGMARIHLRDAAETKDVDLRPLMMELLNRQSQLQMQVADIAADVRAMQEVGGLRKATNQITDALGKARAEASKVFQLPGRSSKASLCEGEAAGDDTNSPEGGGVSSGGLAGSAFPVG